MTIIRSPGGLGRGARLRLADELSVAPINNLGCAGFSRSILIKELGIKLRHLFTINLPIAAFFGLTCSLFPRFAIEMYGLGPNDAAIWTTRLVGGSILGFATLMWFGRSAASVEARRAIAGALLVQDTVGLIASAIVQLSGSVNAFGWSNPLLYGILAIGYAYFVFVQPSNC